MDSDSGATTLDPSRLPTPKSRSQAIHRAHAQILPDLQTLELLFLRAPC